MEEWYSVSWVLIFLSILPLMLISVMVNAVKNNRPKIISVSKTVVYIFNVLLAMLFIGGQFSSQFRDFTNLPGGAFFGFIFVAVFMASISKGLNEIFSKIGVSDSIPEKNMSG